MVLFLTKSNNFIEISANNVTFYSIGDVNLPLRFDSVPSNETRSVYVRASLPDSLTGKEKRVSSITANWEISV